MKAEPAVGWQRFQPAWYYAGLAVVTLVLCMLLERLALQEYFRADDWVFLQWVRSPDYDWVDTFLPFGNNRAHAYRPLGEPGIIALGYPFFGLEPFGYYQLNLLAIVARSFVVYAIALRLGVSRPFAVAAGVLAGSRTPSLLLAWVVVGYAYIGASLLIAAGVLCFMKALDSGGKGLHVATWACLVVGILTHEVGVALPAICAVYAFVHWRPARPETEAGPVVLSTLGMRLAAVVRATWPGWLIVVGYLVVRATVLSPMDERSSAYVFRFTPGLIVRNLWLHMRDVTGDGLSLALCLGASALGLGFWLWRRRSAPSERDPFGVIALVCTAWAVAALAPVLPLVLTALRRSVSVEVPLCILFAALMDYGVRRAAPRWRTPALAVALVIVAASVPWRTLQERLDAPRSDFPRAFMALVDAERDAFMRSRWVVFLHGADDLASEDDRRRFDSLTYGGGPLLRVALPERKLFYTAQDAWMPPHTGAMQKQSIYVEMQHGLAGFSLASPARIDRVIVQPALLHGEGQILMSGVAMLVERGRDAAAARLAEVCASRAARRLETEQECRRKMAVALAQERIFDGASLQRQLREHPQGLPPPPRPGQR